MTIETSVAIIGAGPAGCAAAIHLAQDGIAVCLIEVSDFPRDRPGESLHPGVEPIFEKLGVAEAVNAAGFHRHSGHDVLWGDSRAAGFETFGEDHRGPWLGYQAWRSELDSILLERAKSLGVQCLLNCRASSVHQEEGGVKLETECGTVRAKYLLDGSGRKAWLTRQLGIDWRLHSHKLIARYGYFDSDFEGMYEAPRIERDHEGWTWIAGINQEKCAWVRLRFDGVDPGSAWVPEPFGEVEKRPASKGADVTWRLAERLAGDGWFLLGDAAAVLDPAASHGVLRALMTGMQAAFLIKASLQGQLTREQAASEYQRWLEAWFMSDLERLQELYPSSFFNHHSQTA